MVASDALVEVGNAMNGYWDWSDLMFFLILVFLWELAKELLKLAIVDNVASRIWGRREAKIAAPDDQGPEQDPVHPGPQEHDENNPLNEAPSTSSP